MEQRRWLIRDLVGFAFLYAQLATTIWLVPQWSLARLAEPVYQAE